MLVANKESIWFLNSQPCLCRLPRLESRVRLLAEVREVELFKSTANVLMLTGRLLHNDYSNKLTKSLTRKYCTYAISLCENSAQSNLHQANLIAPSKPMKAQSAQRKSFLRSMICFVSCPNVEKALKLAQNITLGRALRNN